MRHHLALKLKEDSRAMWAWTFWEQLLQDACAEGVSNRSDDRAAARVIKPLYLAHLQHLVVGRPILAVLMGLRPTKWDENPPKYCYQTCDASTYGCAGVFPITRT
jgi:hypothetical protein